MNPVIEIMKQHREQLIDDVVGSLIELVPKYSTADAAEMRSNCALISDEFIKVVETGQTDRLTERLKALAERRVEQGFAPADVLRAMLMTYPAVRAVVRKAGPRNDVVLARAFEEVETALFRMIELAANLFAAGIARRAEQRAGQLEQLNDQLRDTERELQRRSAEQRARAHAAEELSSRVISSLASGVAVLEDTTRRVLLWSARLAEITGVPESEASGRVLDDVVAGIQGLPYRELLETVRATDRLPLTKIHLKLKSGVSRAVFLRAERLRKSDRTSTSGTVLVLDDITERELLIESFSRYVSKEVVQRILSRGGTGPKLESERRSCSVLFADIRGFSAVSERISPEALHELLNQYFHVMIEQVSAHDGIIDKFIGDKIMAVFTSAETDGATAAARAALAIQVEIRKLNARRLSGSEEPIEVGIGVNTGTVVMGTVGSAERMSFTVIGDVVNVADRLQSMAVAGETIIGSRTRELLGERFEVVGLGSKPIKGRVSPEELFRLGAER